MNLFLWVIFPYLCLATMTLGSFYRHTMNPMSWTSKSSQMLEHSRLHLGSMLFHYGLIAAFLGHVAGLLVPLQFYRWLHVPDHFYHLNAVIGGGVAGLVTLIGLAVLIDRRLGSRRIHRYADLSDYASLYGLLLAVGLGVAITVGFQPLAGPYEYRASVGPWIRSLLLLHPDPMLMSGVPLVIQIHVLSGFALFLILPWTRLVHMWSVPLLYPTRAPIQYRRRTPVVGGPRRRYRLRT